MKVINKPEDIAGHGPVLALDVDGVLLAWVNNLEEAADLESRGYIKEGSPSLISYYNPSIGQRLNEIVPKFEVIYCTSHYSHAHKHAGLLFGLPEFGYVPIFQFEDPSDEFNDDRRRALSAVCAGRALAWVEDETIPKDYLWAEQRSANEAPTLIVSPESGEGLTEQHLIEIEKWLEQFSLISKQITPQP